MKIAIAKPCRGLFAVAFGIFVAALLFPSDTDAAQVTCHANASGQSHEIEDISVNLPSDWQVLPARSASARAFALLPQGTPYEDAVCTVQVIWIPEPPTRDLDGATSWYFAQLGTRHPGTQPRAAVQRFSVGNADGRLIRFVRPGDGSGFEEGELMLFASSGRFIAVIATAFQSEWPQASPILTRVLRSVHPNSGASPAQQRTVAGTAQEFQHPEFSFRYPSGWMAMADASFTFAGDKPPQPYYRVALTSPDGAAALTVHYRKFKDDALCGELAQRLEGLLNVEYTISYFDQRELAPGRTDAGEVFSSKATRSRKLPDSEVITSIVCARGYTASVVFYYPTGYPQEARELMMRTLAFGNSSTNSQSSSSPASLVGEWNGEGSVLTLNANGSAELAYLGTNMSNRGRYQLTGDMIMFNWNTVFSLARSEQWKCSYSVRGTQLSLACSPGPAMRFHR